MTKRPLNIILVGKTGCGKSSTGNFIVGKKVFRSKGGFKSTTKEISDAKTSQDGRTIKVVDTPGLFGTDENLFETALKIQTSLKEVSPGPHAFLIVIHGDQKYTKEEIETQQIIQLTFGEKIFKHALIILTHEDKCDSSEELLRQAESVIELQTLIKLCGGRCITLNSLRTDRDYSTGKIKNIVNEVDAISKNGNVCYTEDLTAYTQALKEHANKKTANKDLTADLLATYLANADAQAKRQVEAASADGVASGICKGVAFTAAGILCYKMAKDPKAVRGMILSRNVLKFGFGIGAAILEDKGKRDNQDMHSSPIDCGSLHFIESKWLLSKQSREFLSFHPK